jgi:hypothetical protein
MADVVVPAALEGEAREAVRRDRATLCGLKAHFLTASTLLNTQYFAARVGQPVGNCPLRSRHEQRPVGCICFAEGLI